MAPGLMKMMGGLKKLKPAFWDYRDIADSQGHLSFARKWKLMVLFTSLMALLPLVVMTFVDFGLTRRIIQDEVTTSMSRILHATAAAISFAGDQERATLEYILQAHGLDSGDEKDTFVVTEGGTLITPSFFYGSPGIPRAFSGGVFKGKAGIEEAVAPTGEPVIVGYARIPNSPLVLVLVKSKAWLTDLWFKPRLKLVGYLAASIVVILLSIMGMVTYLMGRIHAADRKKIQALHHAGYANKLASLGRLASGVAHEINNPLAIIHQKIGLITDLLMLKNQADGDERLIPLANDALETVTRCSTITRRLLEFARHMEPRIELMDIKEVIAQTLAFLEKEAQRRHISLAVDVQEPLPGFECDRGSLQQVFLNLFDNAFAAMEAGGRLDICVRFKQRERVIITVSDTGTGIAEEDIHNIFEPFYSSKSAHWGTGLGLSITYGLIKELGGDIRVKSRLGEGTCFTLTLPLKSMKKQEASPGPLKLDSSLTESKQ